MDEILVSEVEQILNNCEEQMKWVRRQEFFQILIIDIFAGIRYIIKQKLLTRTSSKVIKLFKY